MKFTKEDLRKLGFADIDPNSIDIDNIGPDIIDKLTPETRKELEKEFQNLNLSNDFLFCIVMSDPEICRLFLEELLDISIKEIVYTEGQKTINNEFLDKGVRLDVFVNDDKGTIYNIEMQAVDRDDIAKRSRYYQGNIDVNNLKKGSLYKDLKDSYIIFICCFDPFKKGGLKYTFKNSCEEYAGLFLKDGTTKIFLNTKGFAGNISRELHDFLCYTENSTDAFAKTAPGELVKKIHGRVSEVRENIRTGVNYMTMTMRDRMIRYEAEEKAEARGEARGMAKGKAETALRMIKANFSLEIISSMTDLPYDEVLRLKENLVAS